MTCEESMDWTFPRNTRYYVVVTPHNVLLEMGVPEARLMDRGKEG